MEKRAIITVVGKDTVGIIASVCSFLAERRINILDISQTIVQGYFNMMMIADTAACTKDFATVASVLEHVGQELGVQIECQKEAIFECKVWQRILFSKCTSFIGCFLVTPTDDKIPSRCLRMLPHAVELHVTILLNLVL